MIPDRAASDRIPTIANESKQNGTRHQQDVVYLVTNMAKSINKTVPACRIMATTRVSSHARQTTTGLTRERREQKLVVLDLTGE